MIDALLHRPFRYLLTYQCFYLDVLCRVKVTLKFFTQCFYLVESWHKEAFKEIEKEVLLFLYCFFITLLSASMANKDYIFHFSCRESLAMAIRLRMLSTFRLSLNGICCLFTFATGSARLWRPCCVLFGQEDYLSDSRIMQN